MAANAQLLARRKAEGVGQPQPIENPVQALASRNGMTIADYFNALRDPAQSPTVSHRIDTSRVKWDSFDSDRHPDLQRAVRTIKRWYNERLDSGSGLILAGNFGCGKTHLAQAIYALYGFGAVYLNEIKLIEQIQAGYSRSGAGRSLESFAAECRRARLLIYDDLGAYSTDNMNWMQNIYLNLLDGRYEEGKATLITTNLKLVEGVNELPWSPCEDRLGGRVYSRIMGQAGEVEYYIRLFEGPD